VTETVSTFNVQLDALFWRRDFPRQLIALVLTTKLRQNNPKTNKLARVKKNTQQTKIQRQKLHCDFSYFDAQLPRLPTCFFSGYEVAKSVVL